jgi:putative transposase
VKVDVLVSVRANGPKTAALVGERTHDVKLLRVGAWVRNRILLADLGYYSHRLFARIGEHGGFFVTWWKKSADPLFV